MSLCLGRSIITSRYVCLTYFFFLLSAVSFLLSAVLFAASRLLFIHNHADPTFPPHSEYTHYLADPN
jgi:hypothetical protein